MSRPVAPLSVVARVAVVFVAVVGVVAAGCATPAAPGAARAESPAEPSVHSSAAAEVVTTDAGAVRGEVGEVGDDEGIGIATRVFRGVPYAAPPVGDGRWASPRPVPVWPGIRDATGPAPFCAQDGTELGRPSVDEDCLTVDVTTPRATGAPRPVLVWLHGGSHKDGGAAIYPAARLAADGDLVVVTVNYRLGALGYLAHPALPGSGSFGLEDQQAALRWVQRNIAAFGGDPGTVTLAGESGGATAVCAHLASPTAAGLFHRAILQSSDCTARWSPDSPSAPRERDVAERRGREIAGTLGCASAECLRAVPVPALRAASDDGEGMGPTVGTAVLPVDPAHVLAAGRMHRMPVLLGINRDEDRFAVYGQEIAGVRVGPADLRRELDRLAGPRASRARAAYPCDDPVGPADAGPSYDDTCAPLALAAARTGAGYARGTVAAADHLAGGTPTWVYEFADPQAPAFRELPPSRFALGSYHTAELPYLFDAAWAEPLTAGQRRLSQRMIGYWSRFARTGDPNGGGAPSWPGYRGPADVQGLAPDRIGPVPDFAARHRLDLWVDP